MDEQAVFRTIYAYTNMYVNATAISAKRDHDYAGEWRGLWGKVWREEGGREVL